MIDAADFTLEELVENATAELERLGLAGAGPDGRVAPLPDARTVRYYATLGLVDRPRIEGRTARYGPRHLLQLLAVKALQAQGAPLAEVQARLFGRTDAELRSLVSSAAPPADAAAPQPPALLWREIAVAPGLRLQVAEGFAAGDPEALARRLTHALARLANENGTDDTKKEGRP